MCNGKAKEWKIKNNLFAVTYYFKKQSTLQNSNNSDQHPLSNSRCIMYWIPEYAEQASDWFQTQAVPSAWLIPLMKSKCAKQRYFT